MEHQFIYCENDPINNVDVNGEFLETAADLLSLDVSAYEYKNNPTLKNGLMLGWDIVSLAVPFLPGSYAYKAVNLAGDAGKYVKTATASKSAANTSSKVLLNTSRQLQAKFKHASDFGILGNYSKANASKFNSAIHQHINSPGIQKINGTYRGQSVIHYLDPNTGLNVISSPTGQFISGWKLNPEQLLNILKNGRL